MLRPPHALRLCALHHPVAICALLILGLGVALMAGGVFSAAWASSVLPCSLLALTFRAFGLHERQRPETARRLAELAAAVAAASEGRGDLAAFSDRALAREAFADERAWRVIAPRPGPRAEPDR